jgi:hypothetical protein
MFAHSSLYWTLYGSAEKLRTALQEVFVTDFIAKLNPHGSLKGPELLVQLGEAKTYSEAVGGADPKMDMYGILREVDELFQSREHFVSALTERLNTEYGGDKQATMQLEVTLKASKSRLPVIKELMTFRYVELLGGD